MKLLEKQVPMPSKSKSSDLYETEIVYIDQLGRKNPPFNNLKSSQSTIEMPKSTLSK